MKKIFLLIASLLLTSCEDKLNWIKTTPSPIVYSIDPDTGAAGTTVTVNGSNLNSSSEIRITIHETSAVVLEASFSTLKFIAPNETTGPVVVTVNNRTAEKKPVFTYQ